MMLATASCGMLPPTGGDVLTLDNQPFSAILLRMCLTAPPAAAKYEQNNSSHTIE
jgi:hypothetical protein